MEIIQGDQGTTEWNQHRIGSIGGSCIKSLMAKGQYKSRTTLLYQLAGEILSGEKHQIRQTPDMSRGLLLESEARDAFEFISGLEVEQVSLIKRAKHLHVSPDGLTSDNGILEIKCPLASTHVKYLVENRAPIEYIGQIQYSLFITGRPHCYFFSYHPSIRPLLLKVYPDQKYIQNLQTELLKFIKELDTLVEKMR